MRGLAVIGCLVLVDAHVGADPGPPRWQQASGATAIARVWGVGNELYGVGSSGAFHSADGGATWQPADGAGPATGVWGSAIDDVWIVRARTIHHSHDGKNWTTQALPMLSYGAQLEGMWGTDRDRYLFGVDRSDGAPRGVILRSRDGGASWRAEDVPQLDRIAGMWGSDAKDVYAVGSRGAVLRSAGDGAWSIVRPPTGANLEGIWGASATSIYAVGANGQILHSADRGKTWTRRLSGVTYTLSSIVGSGSEILVGSADGPPLRSTDGVAWRPLSAMIGRGVAWSDGDHQLVAGSTGVQVFSDADLDTQPFIPPRGDELTVTKALARAYGSKRPAARDLLLIAAHRLDSSQPLDPGLATRGQYQMRAGKITNCSSALDARSDTRVPSSYNTEVIIDLTCSQSCSSTVTKPTITSVARVWSNGSVAHETKWFVEASAQFCTNLAVDDALQWGPALRAMISVLEMRLMADDAAAFDDDARVEAYAKYLLAGGTEQQVRQRIAALLKKPETWPGFFWNQTVARSPSINSCDPDAVKPLQANADRFVNQGSYKEAAKIYKTIWSCKPSLAMPAFLAACKAKDFVFAKQLFAFVPSNVAQICLNQGFDPR
jgi:photosystem II stability/assembly factor-like uncharacterized protein